MFKDEEEIRAQMFDSEVTPAMRLEGDRYGTDIGPLCRSRQKTSLRITATDILFVIDFCTRFPAILFMHNIKNVVQKKNIWYWYWYCTYWFSAGYLKF